VHVNAGWVYIQRGVEASTALRQYVNRARAPAHPPLVATMPICTIELLLELVPPPLLLLWLALLATLFHRRS